MHIGMTETNMQNSTNYIYVNMYGYSINIIELSENTLPHHSLLL